MTTQLPKICSMLARDQTVRDRLGHGFGLYPTPNSDEPWVGPKNRVGVCKLKPHWRYSVNAAVHLVNNLVE